MRLFMGWTGKDRHDNTWTDRLFSGNVIIEFLDNQLTKKSAWHTGTLWNLGIFHLPFSLSIMMIMLNIRNLGYLWLET